MTQFIEQNIIDRHKEWIYCLDCGLLLEPWSLGKKKVTICDICKQVYTQTSHPWLKKMLALHVNNPKIKKFAIKKVFMCQKCGNYFFQRGKLTRAVCKWCTMLKPDNDNGKKSQCIICNNNVDQRYNTNRVICKTCIEDLENIQRALKYTFHVLAKTKKI